ncbi:NADH-quinone oxidoreductase subunit F [candidate division TA06 bacterium B3_TA06]|uniref:NADH-quinone oxidoreductase subunit F n=1 Tax=candidate division TA06 bacterium B3_TA06 TaxID=2012487 RepID=A0A532V7U2_UNCT6|nr:MAG: NADH-quinone oxidoreductase subunit F [candidate division TA06 bacterium B3_TA06]
MVIKSLADLEKVASEGERRIHPPHLKVMVGAATCGIASGANDVIAAVEQTLKSLGNGAGATAVASRTGCIGMCYEEPLMDILKPGWPRITYSHVKPEQVAEILSAVKEGKVVKEGLLGKIEEIEDYTRNTRTPTGHFHNYSELALRSQGHNTRNTHYRYPLENVPPEIAAVEGLFNLEFTAKQQHIAMRNCGIIDPESIEEYIARGGYRGLYRVLTEMKPDEVIDMVDASGLRGRGGGGFGTGRKWRYCKAAEGYRYVICNADEGDPGAYMDRSLLEGDPHSILEGMLIGAFAIGSQQGYVYVRAEYPLAVKRLEKAIDDARVHGLLGSDIFGTGFNFDLRIVKGGGAFVCGESTALMASIEGKPGEPRAKYVHTVEKGLWNQPTTLNNVETWANVPVIAVRGAEWFASIGNPSSTGTKIFSLVGKVNRAGLVEVPMGITLREIIYDIGGGIPEGKPFKAVQTGGPSGGCIPANLLDLEVDFDRLWEAGSMMGSGGMIVMDSETCMVDVAKFFTEFLKDESCGKCVPCREGLSQTHEILKRITEGEGQESDLDLLEELGKAMQDSSLCALGGSAPNPVLSTLRFFRDEYLEHIKNKRCPAGVCTALIHFEINENCTGCTLCVRNCPVDAISGERKQVHVIDQDVCIKCGVCLDVCKFDAVTRNTRNTRNTHSGGRSQ